MRRVLLLLLLTGAGFVAQAQTIPALNPDEDRIARCVASVRNDPAQSRTIALELLQRPQLTARVEARALACLAHSRQLLGDREGVAEALTRVQALIDGDALTGTERLQAIVSTFSLLQYLGRGAEALERMTEAQALAEAQGDRGAQMVSLLGIGHVHAMELGDLERALEYFSQVRELAPPQSRLQIDGAYAHAYTLMGLGRHDEARPGLERLLIDAARAGQHGTVLRVRSHLAEIARVQGDLDGARAAFETLYREQQTLGDPAGEAITRLRLARVHLANGALGLAHEHAGQALAMMEHGAFDLEIMEALALLASIHEAAGEPAAALPLLRREREMATARIQRQNLAQLAVLQENLEDVSLAHRDARQQAELAQAQRRRDMAWAALAMVLVLGGAIGVHQWRSNRRLRELGATDPLTGLLNRREMLRRRRAVTIGWRCS